MLSGKKAAAAEGPPPPPPSQPLGMTSEEAGAKLADTAAALDAVAGAQETQEQLQPTTVRDLFAADEGPATEQAAAAAAAEALPAASEQPVKGTAEGGDGLASTSTVGTVKQMAAMAKGGGDEAAAAAMGASAAALGLTPPDGSQMPDAATGVVDTMRHMAEYEEEKTALGAAAGIGVSEMGPIVPEEALPKAEGAVEGIKQAAGVPEAPAGRSRVALAKEAFEKQASKAAGTANFAVQHPGRAALHAACAADTARHDTAAAVRNRAAALGLSSPVEEDKQGVMGSLKKAAAAPGLSTLHAVSAADKAYQHPSEAVRTGAAAAGDAMKVSAAAATTKLKAPIDSTTTALKAPAAAAGLTGGVEKADQQPGAVKRAASTAGEAASKAASTVLNAPSAAASAVVDSIKKSTGAAPAMALSKHQAEEPEQPHGVVDSIKHSAEAALPMAKGLHGAEKPEQQPEQPHGVVNTIKRSADAAPGIAQGKQGAKEPEQQPEQPHDVVDAIKQSASDATHATTQAASAAVVAPAAVLGAAAEFGSLGSDSDVLQGDTGKTLEKLDSNLQSPPSELGPRPQAPWPQKAKDARAAAPSQGEVSEPQTSQPSPSEGQSSTYGIITGMSPPLPDVAGSDVASAFGSTVSAATGVSSADKGYEADVSSPEPAVPGVKGYAADFSTSADEAATAPDAYPSRLSDVTSRALASAAASSGTVEALKGEAIATSSFILQRACISI